MSKPAPQIIPEHMEALNGRLVNCDTHERDIQSLKDYAEQEGFPLESECQTQYGIPVEWITREQRSDLFLQAVRFRRARLEASGFHYHRCFDCKEVSGCLEPDCKKTEIECRPCHEGYTQSEWTTYHRKAAYRGDL